MTVTVYDFPREWYDNAAGAIVTQKFNLRSINQVASRPWSGAGNAINGPHTQLWLTDVTFSSMRDPLLQDVDAFFSQLRGRAGVVRMSNALRLAPWYDRNIASSVATWSDGSRFTDGSGFANGHLPPEVFVYAAAARGTRYLTLGGFPVSTANVLRRGDLLQVKPNGIAGSVPMLFKAMFGGDSDSSGRVGVAIEPGLRIGVAAGDQVSLRYPSTLFRLTDDSQFDFEGTGGGIGAGGGSLVEALDLVP